MLAPQQALGIPPAEGWQPHLPVGFPRSWVPAPPHCGSVPPPRWHPVWHIPLGTDRDIPTLPVAGTPCPACETPGCLAVPGCILYGLASFWPQAGWDRGNKSN